MNVQGISVLSSEVILTPNWLGVLFLIFGGFLIWIGTGRYLKKKWKKYNRHFAIIGFIMMSLVVFVRFPFLYKEDCIEYKCVINETASFTEVYKKFTIEDVEGKIWTIRTKGEENGIQ